MRRIGAAIVGVGFVGVQHLEAVRRLGRVEVVAVAASTPERSAAAGEQYGTTRSVPTYRDAILDADVEVVHVCVPNDLHHVVVGAALDAGKHVICEKPLARTLAEARELAKRAEQTERVTVLCHNYRFFPMAAELRAMAQGGALGQVHQVRGSYLQDWLLSASDTNWRVDPDRGGQARVIGDIGSHWLDLAEVVTGRRLEAVMAQIGTVHARRPARADRLTFSAAAADGDGTWQSVTTEDQASLLLRFEGGLQGAVVLSHVAAGHKNGLKLSVDGSEASATWWQERPDELWIGRRDRPNEVVARDPRLLSAAAGQLARLPAGHNEGWADGLRNLLSAAYEAIDTGTPPSAVPLPSFADGLRHHEFMVAAMESAQVGRWVEVAEVRDRSAEPLTSR